MMILAGLALLHHAAAEVPTNDLARNEWKTTRLNTLDATEVLPSAERTIGDKDGHARDELFPVSANFLARQITSRRLPALRAAKKMFKERAVAHYRRNPKGKFTEIRTTLDHEFHGLYELERQCTQDKIIEQFLDSAGHQKHPVVVYLAGPMGAGKGHTADYLDRRSGPNDPLLPQLKVDPDYFKTQLPEWKTYPKDTRASLLHQESGYMAEIAIEALLQKKASFVVDGSLHNLNWWKDNDVRKIRNYEDYTIGTILVTAKEELIRKNVKARAAKKDGRECPMDKVEKTMEVMSRDSQDILRQNSDAFLVVENVEGQEPMMKELSLTEPSSSVSRQFERASSVLAQPSIDWSLEKVINMLNPRGCCIKASTLVECKEGKDGGFLAEPLC